MSDSSSPSVVLVTGGTGSVGMELASRLRTRGAKIIIGGRNADKLAAAGDQLDVETVELDALESGSIEGAINSIVANHGRIDGVANCIGSILLKPAHLTSIDEFDQTIHTNLRSSFEVVRACGKGMRKTGGSVVLVSTAAAAVGIPSHEAIAAAKAGIEGLARSAAATYARSNIRFNVVAPGLVRSEMSRGVWDNEASAAASLDMHALGRFGEPADVARAIEFLLERENSWMTGQVIGVDGGLSRVLPRAKR